jgi:hypothetical protein
MGYECIKDCQIEVAPGRFRFVRAGQKELERGVPISYVKPISRQYFRLSGDDLKKDIQDKIKIKKALDKRKLRFPKNGRTSDLAKILAEDNDKRGVVNLESLEVVESTTHFADADIKKAKTRIDELFGLSDKAEKPYDDKTSLDTLHALIDKKEAKIAGIPEPQEGSEPTNAELKAILKDRNVKHNPNDNKTRLKELVVGSEPTE